MPSGSGVKPEGKNPIAVPSGTVTFLFSDIEGSTQRWEMNPEAMKAAVARHEQLVSAAIKQHNGYVFKSMGDAFCAAFHTAPDAVLAALDAQLALAKEDFTTVDNLRVRMGLHTGYADERDNDYFGPTVNRVARLMSIGHGGQVLLSGVTRDLAHSDLPAGAELIDLGSHRLSDLTEPERVWQLSFKGLATNFPALKSLGTIPNNLFVQPTSFRGRERDLEALKSLLSKHKLITLSGSGGIGKTRLAVEAGTEVLDRYPDGVWFVDFAPITDPQLVASAIAKELGMSQVEGRQVDESILQFLKRKKLLLILDNCEHLLEAVATIANAITRGCPDVRLLATSRQALGISGEEILRLPSLEVPHEIADLTPSAVMEFGAVALFVDRARSVDQSFAPTDENAPVIADICRRLDGIPLAIELAAARVKVLSIPNLAKRLNDRFKILTGGSRTALPRQKTLTALIDWSYDLLSPQEQMLFTRASIFAGGFSLEAASAVCMGDGIEEQDVLDLLSSLTDKSLIVADTGGEQERYRLLESTRAYALEKLAAAGTLERLARRHADYFCGEARAAEARYGRGSTSTWLARVELELDNYRAALEWSIAEGKDVALAGAMAGALERLWFHAGLEAEGRYWIDRVRASLDEAAYPQVAARLRRALALLSDAKPKYEHAERALALYQSVGDGHGAAWSLIHLGQGLCQMGRLEEASDAYERAVEAMRGSGDEPLAALCLRRQGETRWFRGDIEGGREMFAQALVAFNALGDEAGTSAVLGNLAELEFADGHADQALRLAGEALKIQARGKNTQYLTVLYQISAAYRIALGDETGAAADAREGLRLARQTQETLYTAIALQYFALVGALQGEVRNAARLMGYVNAQFKELRYERETTEKWGYEKLTVALREHLDEAEIEKLASEGAAWFEDQAVEEALKI
jgi:predicted ATPase/class 3 adenylate cyclase